MIIKNNNAHIWHFVKPIETISNTVTVLDVGSKTNRKYF
jgi:hypothetical protein